MPGKRKEVKSEKPIEHTAERIESLQRENRILSCRGTLLPVMRQDDAVFGPFKLMN